MDQLSSLTSRQIKTLLVEFKADKGYCLDFNHSTMEDFIYNSIGIESSDTKYKQNGKSMGKTLASILSLESDDLVAKLVADLRNI